MTYTYEGVDYLYAFVRTDTDHLSVCRWDGGGGTLWADLGGPTSGGHDIAAQPNGGDTIVWSAPGVVPFRYAEPERTTDRIFAFVRGSDGHLHQCYWNGIGQWLWSDLGTPPAHNVTFARDIRPLFRQLDINAMSGFFAPVALPRCRQ